MSVSEPVPVATPAPIQPHWSKRLWIALAGVFLVALALRLPFVMHSLDERDSANFALASINFDVLTHQPHPPGQFYYAMLCQVARFVVGNEITAVSLLSAVFSAATLIPYYLILRLIFGRTSTAVVATALTAFSFGFWMTGLRPISDPVGCFFVYATICALLYGLKNPRWFCAGMVLFGGLLGVKQLSVYFLAPFVLTVNVIVLAKQGWRPVLAGAILFAVLFLGWLVPTVLNVGDWHRFLEISRHQQAENYLYESLVTHLSAEQVQLHAVHDAVWLWGFGPLAGVTLLLAAAGIKPLWRAGAGAKLFLLFGLTTVLYIFLVLGVFSKYYAYTAPVYSALAAAGLARITAWPLFTRIVSGRILLIAGAGMLILIELVVSVPRLREMKAFRSPSQAAYEYLVRRHGPDLRGVDVITNQSGTVAAAMRYFQAKSGLYFADFDDYFDYVIPELGLKKEFYLFSFLSGGASSEHLELVDTFVWKNTLRKILQAQPIDYRLFLYKVRNGLPPTYRIQDGQIAPLLLSRRLDTDGWVSPDCDLILPSVPGSPTSFVRLIGTVSDEFDFQQPLRVKYKTLSRSSEVERSFTLTKPGPFSVLLNLDKPRNGSVIGVNIVTETPDVPATPKKNGADARHLTWRLVDLQCAVPTNPLLFSYTDGSWYDLETARAEPNQRSAKARSWRWCQGEGKLEIGAGKDGTLAVKMVVLSTKGHDHAEVLLDGSVVGTVDLPDAGGSPPQTLRLPVKAGLHTLAFQGQRPGENPSPTDSRLLSIGVQDLRITLE